MSKITDSEIKNWSNFFWEFTKKYIVSERFKNSYSSQEQEEVQSMLVISKLEAEKGNSVALFFLAKIVEEEFIELPTELWIELKNKLGLDNFRTFFDYTDQIKKRLAEHHIARGYYQPAHSLSLEEFKQKRDKVGWGKGGKFDQDETYRNKLLAEMSEEDRQFIWRTYSYTIKMEELFKGEEDRKITEKEYQEKAFYLEDIVKTLESAQTKLEKKKKTILLHHSHLLPILINELSTN